MATMTEWVMSLLTFSRAQAVAEAHASTTQGQVSLPLLCAEGRL